MKYYLYSNEPNIEFKEEVESFDIDDIDGILQEFYSPEIEKFRWTCEFVNSQH